MSFMFLTKLNQFGVAMRKVARLFQPVLAVLCLLVCGCNNCSETPIMRIDSPGGKYSARLVECDCGATVDSFNKVKITPSSFFSEEATVTDGTGVESIRWIDSNTLEVRSAAQSRFYQQDKESKGAKIVYTTSL